MFLTILAALLVCPLMLLFFPLCVLCGRSSIERVVLERMNLSGISSSAPEKLKLKTRTAYFGWGLYFGVISAHDFYAGNKLLAVLKWILLFFWPINLIWAWIDIIHDNAKVEIV